MATHLRGSSSTKSRKRCVVMTGFGAFGGVENNPTKMMINSLSQSTISFFIEGETISIIYRIIDVAVDAVDRVLDEICIQYVDYDIVFVHLGVDANATTIKLESTAYNMKHFRIPDVHDYQPLDEPIHAAMAKDYPMVTSWDMQRLLEDVQTFVKTLLPGFDHNQIQCSSDPGRYLCNYIYFRTLLLQRSQGQQQDLITRSFFIHVPSFEVISMEIQLSAVQYIAKTLCYRALIEPYQGIAANVEVEEGEEGDIFH